MYALKNKKMKYHTKSPNLPLSLKQKRERQIAVQKILLTKKGVGIVNLSLFHIIKNNLHKNAFA